MRLAIIAHRQSGTNAALVDAGRSLGVDTLQLTPREALHALLPGDVALGRLDVQEAVDGIEDGMRELEKLAAAGVTVLNPPAALAATHDKLLTSRALRRAGLPHPHTWLIADGLSVPASPRVTRLQGRTTAAWPPSFAASVPELPVVLKPRHGSWGRGVTLCRTHDDVQVATRALFSEHGVLAQELVPPLGWDIRVLVAGGRVVGAARRIAAEGEWRTNVSLGGRSVPHRAAPLARSLAILAADAVHADLVGVDLLPTRNGWVIAELNGAVDFHAWYGEDVFAAAVLELLRTATARRTAAA